MRLAIVDAHDEVLIAWPTVAEAHQDLADRLALVVVPDKRFRDVTGQRAKVANKIREHLLELQAETQRL